MQKHLFWSAMLQIISKRFFYAIYRPPRILKSFRLYALYKQQFMVIV